MVQFSLKNHDKWCNECGTWRLSPRKSLA